MNPLVTENNITEYLPHRPPMIMVDTLYSVDEESAVSGLHLNSGNIFCKNNRFTEPGIIENMAQTAALHSGYLARRKGETPAVGFIGAVKKFTILRLPGVNNLLITTVTILNRFGNALIIKGESRCNNELVAQGEMNIFLQIDQNREI